MAKRLVSAPLDYEPWPVEYLIDEEEETKEEGRRRGEAPQVKPLLKSPADEPKLT